MMFNKTLELNRPLGDVITHPVKFFNEWLISCWSGNLQTGGILVVGPRQLERRFGVFVVGQATRHRLCS